MCVAARRCLLLFALLALLGTALACGGTPTPSRSSPATPVTLTVTAGEGGSVAVSPEPSADGTHPSGTTATITATADKGYDFSAWAGLPDDATVTAGPAAVTTTSGIETSTASFTVNAAATVTAGFKVESTPYSLRTTGAVTEAGSYALLSDPDDLASAIVEWSELGYTNPPYGLLLHTSDATNVSRASYYGAIAVGDRVDAWWGDRCLIRFTVTELRPDPARTPARKLFVIDDVAWDGAECVWETREADAAHPMEFRWRQPPWRVAADGLREMWKEAVPGPGRYQFHDLSIEVPENMSLRAGLILSGGKTAIVLTDPERTFSIHFDAASGVEISRRTQPLTPGATGMSEQDINALLDQIAGSVRVGRGQ